MAPRIFDQTSFKAQGAMITYGSLLTGHDQPIDLFDFGNKVLLTFLRWQVNPKIGLPSEPFKVWRRPAMPLGDERAIGTSTVSFPPIGTVVSFDEPVVSFSGTLQAGSSAQQVLILPLADGIGPEHIVGTLSFDIPANGSRTFTFQAPYITAIWLVGTASISSLTALPLSAADKVRDWELVETVGFPVDNGDWSDLSGQSHGIDQGPVAAPLPAKAAAAHRYARGVNPFGWRPQFATGQPAPTWKLPNAAELIKEDEAEILPMIHKALSLPPEDQAAFTQTFAINPPENGAGQSMSGDDGTAEVAPLTLLQMAAATDPLQAVILGFGTGLPYEDIPTINLGKIQLFGDSNVSDWDYMITGLWHAGLNGRSGAVEYAALVPRPRKVIPAPAPADLQIDPLGHHQPAAPDQPWTTAARLSWERFSLDNLTKVASFAVGRADTAVPGPALALMERRTLAAGHQPIGDARNTADPETVRQSATDSSYPIPNNPGSVAANYGVATQNIFGIWSPWVDVPFVSNQPPPDLVRIVDANLVPTDPGGNATLCPATLQLDFVLDWRARRVQSVAFRGRLFIAATRHDDPPPGLPAQVQTALSGASKIVAVTFAGDTPSATGGSIISLDAQGENQVAAGVAGQGESRRYRLTVPGFSLNYAAARHIGLALKARATESLAPNRNSAWSPTAKVAYASDPRARATNITPIVPLTSLPDARGECHAKLDWADQPAAIGYAIYASNEFNILERTGTPHPAPGSSLSDRLIALKAAFNANPDRNAFSRINADLHKTTTMDVVLPRGSQAINTWVILPVSAGGIEGPWPSGATAADNLIVYAAPKVAEPAPPRIEARRVEQGGGFVARLRVETRGTSGAYPRRIDLYRTRVADAARRVDSMGFPIAEIVGSSGPWTTEPASPAPAEWLDSLIGTDAPDGSWKQVWYRAVAWADPIPENGVLAGRSIASPAVPVMVPPAGPPPLSALDISWPGGGVGNIQFDFTTPVPVPPTPLGPHVLEIDAVEQGIATPMVRASTPIQNVATSSPGGADSGLWQVADGHYRVLLRRADVSNAASLAIRLTDPLGRTSERTHRVDAGPILPVPAISPITAFTITGRGRFYTFTVDGTMDEEISGGFYRLRLELEEAPTGPRPFPVFPLSRRTGRFERITPTPGPIITPFPLRRGTQFSESGGLLVFDRPIGQVPTIHPNETFAVARQRIGDRVTITLIAKAKLAGVAAIVTSPDGTTATRRARG